MKIKILISVVLIAILVACGQTDSRHLDVPDTPPNIVLIFTDDQGYADLGIMGLKDDIRTPHLDALARRGILMTQGYVSAPTCVPSRAGLLTGRHQNTFGVDTNLQMFFPEVQAQFNALENIPGRLRKAGYTTGMSGKWHLGSHLKMKKLGIDQFWITEAGKDPKNINPEDYALSQELVETGYHVDQGSAFASAFIEKNKDEPFFFYWAPRAPHVPLDAPQSYLDRFPDVKSERRQQGLAMISAIDDGVGKIVEALKKNDLLHNTMIIFISDNGAPLRIDMRENGPVISGWDGSLNDPLTGEKDLLMEGGIRVPFLISWPARLPINSRYERPVLSIDVAPTIYAAADLEPQADLPGKDLTPFILGQKTGDPHEYMYWKYGAQSAIRSGDWKMIEFDGSVYLYNLAEDLKESNNLAELQPLKLSKLKQQKSNWIAGLPDIPDYEPTTFKKRVERRRIFYNHYLDKKEVDVDRIYMDWVYGLSVSDIEAARQRKIKKERDRLKQENAKE